MNIKDYDYIRYDVNGKTLLVNYKMIVGKGGNQTRSLREVYHFIEQQLKYLLNKFLILQDFNFK